MIYHFTVSTDFRSPQEYRFIESREHIDEQAQFVPIIFDKYPGNVARFNYLPIDVKHEDWVLFTDTSDVIFQKELPDLQKVNCDIYVGNERTLHMGSYWDNVCQTDLRFRNLLQKTIYNAGMFLMRGDVYIDYLLYFSLASKTVENTFYDQLLFNEYLQKEGLKINDDITVLCPLYSNIDLGLVKKVDGIWKTDLDEVICCVHGNGSYKKYL